MRATALRDQIEGRMGNGARPMVRNDIEMVISVLRERLNRLRLL